jgi:hypothetical protein
MNVRAWIARWHAGQLILAWLPLALLWCCGVAAILFVGQSVGNISSLQNEINRDAVAREPANFRLVYDSVDRLRASDAPSTAIEDYVAGQGFRAKETLTLVHEELDLARKTKYFVWFRRWSF